jgi:hypothetical protein
MVGMVIAGLFFDPFFENVFEAPAPFHPDDVTVGFRITFFIALLVAPVGIIAVFARYKLYAAVSTSLTLAFLIVIILFQSQQLEESSLMPFVFFPTIWISPLILLSVAPAKAVSRRLIFLALGLVLLIALNELSKLGLDVTAPKQG